MTHVGQEGALGKIGGLGFFTCSDQLFARFVRSGDIAQAASGTNRFAVGVFVECAAYMHPDVALVAPAYAIFNIQNAVRLNGLLAKLAYSLQIIRVNKRVQFITRGIGDFDWLVAKYLHVIRRSPVRAFGFRQINFPQAI